MAPVPPARHDGPASPGTADPPDAAQPGMVPGLAPGIVALLPAARAARDGLRRDGRPLTRDTLAACLRQNGYRSETPGEMRWRLGC